jgi:4-diphosphocytidyl-2-C-methyl-D-erythritol kinase
VSTEQRVSAPAKINLRLAVLAREAAGYHQLETIFCRLALADEVAIRAAGDGIALDVQPPAGAEAAPDLGPAAANLAVRAARAFFDAARLEPHAAIRLVKRIPAAAGLGGGSSDAAAVLQGLNRLHGLPLSDPDLLELGAGLGSDVPFFLAGGPLALAWGRGGRLAPLPALPRRPVVLAVSPVAVATAEAYAALAATRGADYRAPATVIPRQLDSWEAAAAVAGNDFEAVVFDRLPMLAALRAALERSGARIARMSGTGSTVFGIYDDDAVAAQAAERLDRDFRDVRFVVTHTAR